MQVALFKSVTTTNLMKPYAQKTGATVIKAFRWIAGKFDKKLNVEEPEVTDIQDLIRENYQRLQKCNRNVLEQLLREEIKKRLHEDISVRSTIDDENLSVAVNQRNRA